MIERNEIPLFEYDATSSEVIPPAHEFGDCRFPKKCLFAFLGDTIHRYAEAKHAEKRCEFRTVSATYPIYVFKENGEEICLAQAPIGAPPASSMLDALIASGCRKILALGSCGVLKKLPENAFLVPTRALRDEGSSYHYLPASRYIELDSAVLTVIERVLKAEGLPLCPLHHLDHGCFLPRDQGYGRIPPKRRLSLRRDGVCGARSLCQTPRRCFRTTALYRRLPRLHS